MTRHIHIHVHGSTHDEGAFKKLENKLERKGESEHEAGAVAYLAGEKKYGKAGMAEKSAAARKK